MNKILALIFLIFTSIFNLNSQNSGVVKYKFIRNDKQPFEYDLYFNSNESIFITNQGSRKKVLKVLEKNLKLDTFGITDKELIEAATLQKTILTYDFDEEGDVFYKNFRNNKLIFRLVNKNNPIIVSEPQIPKLKWSLQQEETKIIGKFICQKATTSFRGRDYEAWYTLEIPISNGPWKFQGLPGLILEIYTTDKDRSFSYTIESIEILSNINEKIKPPILGEKRDIFSYQKEIEEKENERIKKINSQSQENRSGFIITRSIIPFQELDYNDIKK